jgi:hypothetical protein
MAVWTVFLSTIELSPYSLTDLSFDLKNLEFDWIPGLRRKIHPELYRFRCNKPLYLNIFRGEPAISGFDCYFSAIHKSSHSFATL